MILTIKDILDSFGDEIPKLFSDSLGTLAPEVEIIRKQLPARLLRFEEGETAIVGVISDLRKDRDDEVLLPEGMDDSNYSGVVLWQHDYWREGIPHARSLWRELDPKTNPHTILAKTQYLTDLSDLGNEVYEYRKQEHPLGQSVGFRAIESVFRGDTGYNDVFKDWKARAKAMLKEKKIKATQDEFSEPRRIFTKWELWEYSDVFIGSNVDALQEAVSKGMLTNAEAKLLVDFKAKDAPQEPEEIGALLKRVADLEEQIKQLQLDHTPLTPALDLQDMWGADKTTALPADLDDMWNGNEM